MKKFLSGLLFFTLILNFSLPVFAVPAKQNISAPTTQLQGREYQTRLYDTKDNITLMKAVINALQDDGFILKETNTQLGLITANKEFSQKGKASPLSIAGNSIGLAFGTLLAICSFGILVPIPIYFAIKLAKGSNDIYTIEATANISDYGNKTKVRINFQQKLLKNEKNDQQVNVKNLEDLNYYQAFFSKLDKSLFIQNQGL